MKNTNNHQSIHCIFSQQADTSLEQHLPTSGLVLADPRTSSLRPAALTRDLPLAVELDTERDPAPQPAIPAAERLNQPTHQDPPVFSTEQATGTGIVPTHTRPAERGVQHDILPRVSSRTSVPRPDSQAQTQTSKRPSAGEAHQQANTQPQRSSPDAPSGVYGKITRVLQPRAKPRASLLRIKNLPARRQRTTRVFVQKPTTARGKTSPRSPYGLTRSSKPTLSAWRSRRA